MSLLQPDLPSHRFRDALHALWSVLWFGLVWGPMSDYVEAIAKGLPNKPPGFMDSLDAFTAVAIVITALLGVAYFAIKIGIAGLGFRFSGRIDREDTADEAPPPVDPNLGWAD